MPYPRYTGQVVNTRICWRSNCNERVDRHDTLGLCPGCIAEMRDPDYTKELSEYELPINADAHRSV